jgi:hypothetical protein
MICLVQWVYSMWGLQGGESCCGKRLQEGSTQAWKLYGGGAPLLQGVVSDLTLSGGQLSYDINICPADKRHSTCDRPPTRGRVMHMIMTVERMTVERILMLALCGQ